MTYGSKDWWENAIERNRAALLRIVTVLWFRVGLDEGGADSVPRHVWRAVLLLLRPAESAVRRLVLITARDIAVSVSLRARPRKAKVRNPGPGQEHPETETPHPPQTLPLALAVRVFPPAERKPVPKTGIFWQGRLLKPGETPWLPKPEAEASPRDPAFALFDPPRPDPFDPPRLYAKAPVIRSLFDDPLPVYLRRPEPVEEPEPFPDGETGAASLCRRLVALKHALDDLPGHAVRYARRNARYAFEFERALYAPASEATLEGATKFPAPPMRIGQPPGGRMRGKRPIDEILRECHSLALMASKGTRQRGAAGEELKAGERTPDTS